MSFWYFFTTDIKWIDGRTAVPMKQVRLYWSVSQDTKFTMTLPWWEHKTRLITVMLQGLCDVFQSFFYLYFFLWMKRSLNIPLWSFTRRRSWVNRQRPKRKWQRLPDKFHYFCFALFAKHLQVILVFCICKGSLKAKQMGCHKIKLAELVKLMSCFPDMKWADG